MSPPVREWNLVNPMYPALTAAALGLLPYCVPLTLLRFERAGSCSDLWVTGSPIYAALLIGIGLGQLGLPREAAVPGTPLQDLLLRVSRRMLLVSVFANQAAILAALAVYGQADVLTYHRIFDDVPGLSLVIQNHIPFLIPFLVLSHRSGRPWRRLLIVLLLTLAFRGVMLAERLGLAEALVLALIGRGLVHRVRLRPAQIFAFAVIVSFAWYATEFSRNYYRQLGAAAAWNPALLRLGGQWFAERLVAYYADPANKLLLAVQHTTPLLFPEVFLALPYRALELLGIPHADGQSLLGLQNLGVGGGFTFPELTNPGGVTVLVLEWGWWGAVLVTSILGVVLGRTYQGGRRAQPLALMLYGGFFIAVLELPRVFYLATVRFFVPIAVGLTVMGLAILTTRPPLDVGSG